MRDQWSMSNSLKVSLQTTIYSLSDRGWSRRRIARELGIDRETVGRYLRLAKPAISTTGPEGVGEAKPAIPTTGSEEAGEAKPAVSTGNGVGRKSQCEPLAELGRPSLGSTADHQKERDQASKCENESAATPSPHHGAWRAKFWRNQY
jgi:hypothetical protein